MLKGTSFAKAIAATETAINRLYNRSIKQIPEEVFKQEGPLGIKIEEEDVNEAVEKMKKEMDQRLTKRVKPNIEIGKSA